LDPEGALDDKKKEGYSVGYKKPPQHTQFQPGKSGNPKGRPKKVATINELFLKELHSRIPITANGRRRMISLAQAIVKQLANKAAIGDYKAARLVFDQLRSDKPEYRDNIANLIEEFRAVNARYEAEDVDQRPLSASKAKKRT
jgi:hypothetical protein